MKEKRYEADQIFRALGDKHRLQILDLLMEQERNAGELLEMLDVVQSTLSHHMKSLCEAGLVAARKEGKWTYYSIAPEAMQVASQFMERYQGGTAKKSEKKTAADKPSEKKRAVKSTADKPAEKKRTVKKTTLAHQSKNAEDIFDGEQKKRRDKEHDDVWAPVKTEEKAGKGNTKKDKKASAKAGKKKAEKAGKEKEKKKKDKDKNGKK